MTIERKIIQVANRLADISGEIASYYFRNLDSFSLKLDKSPVTIADLKIEEALRNFLKEEFPNHSFHGEEKGSTNSQTINDYEWIIDPIDGTVAFTFGKPIFTTLISLSYQGNPILSIINQPITKERWIGMISKKTSYNKTICQSNFKAKINSARLNCTTPAMFKKRKDLNLFNKLKRNVALVSYGGDAYSYGLLSSGHIDIIFEADLKYYDVAALIPIIKGAGGMITDWKGKDLKKVNFDGKCLATASQELHYNCLNLIN